MSTSSWVRPGERDRAALDAALRIQCPTCGRPAGDYCVSPAGEPYRAFVSHPARIKAATP